RSSPLISKHNKQLQIFNGHTSRVYGIEFSQFNGGRYLCSGSWDNTIRFWDIRSNKKELFSIEGSDEKDNKIICLKFVSLRKKVSDNEQNLNDECGIYLYYGLHNGSICVWE
ncbi:WD-40 repeat protein, partial [Reticulomyxa filosa]